MIRSNRKEYLLRVARGVTEILERARIREPPLRERARRSLAESPRPGQAGRSADGAGVDLVEVTGPVADTAATDHCHMSACGLDWSPREDWRKVDVPRRHQPTGPR